MLSASQALQSNLVAFKTLCRYKRAWRNLVGQSEIKVLFYQVPYFFKIHGCIWEDDTLGRKLLRYG